MSLLVFFIIHHIARANAIGLIVESECVSFQNISSHPDTSGEYHQIGWIKVISCIEGGRTNKDWTFYRNDYLSLSSFSISIKFQPSGGTNNTDYDNLTVIAKPYSNPIRYGLNYNREVSYTYNSFGYVSGYVTTSDWIGTPTALARLNQHGCYGTRDGGYTETSYKGYPNDLHERIYHACGNPYGLHISPNRDKTTWNQCAWENVNPFDNDIEVYFGFVPEDCDPESAIKIPSTSPSYNPSMIPTLTPTRSSTKDPTISPTQILSTLTNADENLQESPPTPDDTTNSDVDISREIAIVVTCSVCVYIIMIICVWVTIRHKNKRTHQQPIRDPGERSGDQNAVSTCSSKESYNVSINDINLVINSNISNIPTMNEPHNINNVKEGIIGFTDEGDNSEHLSVGPDGTTTGTGTGKTDGECPGDV